MQALQLARCQFGNLSPFCNLLAVFRTFHPLIRLTHRANYSVKVPLVPGLFMSRRNCLIGDNVQLLNGSSAGHVSRLLAGGNVQVQGKNQDGKEREREIIQDLDYVRGQTGCRPYKVAGFFDIR